MNARISWPFLLLFITSSTNLMSQTNLPDKSATTVKKEEKKHWYETISLRGYMQVRYNRLLETNDKLKCEQCDKSWGEGGGVFIRRGRLILSGNLTKNIYFYIQPDFGSAAGTTQHIFQLRDAYFDIGFDKDNEYRVRIGQSKVPFGFENMQSSQNRLPLDRNDGLNSAVSNERDLGAFFYWAPKEKRDMFAMFVRENLKGSGDYGVFAFGFYNGQTANRAELNKKLHIVSRFSYPIKIGKQIIEPGIQAYAGDYVLPSDLRTTGVKAVKSFEFKDQRAAASFVLYPQPFGIQAEYNVGKGPQYNPAKDSIEVKKLNGGYITVSYKIKGKNEMVFLPYTRAQHFTGGKKHELDARNYNVDELEVGLEWQVNKNFEFTTAYTFSKRRFEDSKLRNNLQSGRLLRLQAQLNF
ncbi:MAG: porin [Flavihumibacter sp.]|nr:porin [Flavihumibacter sp.]